MPTTTKKLLIGIFLVALLLLPLSALMFWSLASTPAGTQWLAGQVKRVSGDAVAWEQLEGSLLQSLRLRGLRLRLPGIDLDIHILRVEWRPALLASGTVQLDRVAADGIRITLTDSPEADLSAEPFNPADLNPPIDLVLEALELRGIELRRGGSPPRLIDSISLAARLEGDQLRLQQLQIHSEEGELVAQGKIKLTQEMPLDLDAQWDWRLPDQRQLGGQLQAAGDLDNYRVASEGRLVTPGFDAMGWSLTAQGSLEGMQLGSLTVTGGPYELALLGAISWNGPVIADLRYRAGADQLAALNPQLPPRLDATGTVLARYEDETLTLKDLSLVLAQAPLRADMQGTVRLPAGGEPILDGELQWHSLQWPLSTSATEATVSSPQGRVLLAGTPDAWNVDLAMQLAGSQIPAGQWLGRGDGDRSELHLDFLHGKLLDGTVAFSGSLAWDPVPRWNLQAGGNHLNPGKWQPDIPGQLSFEVRSEGRLDQELGPQAIFELRQLSGELSGRSLSLTGKGTVAGDAVALETLALHSGKNHFSASGRFGARSLALDWALRVPEPGLLLPGADGLLEASGQLAGSPASPRLQARLAGHDLRFADQYLPRLAASLQAGLAAQDPLQLDIELGPLQQGEQTQLDSARLSATGTTASHRLDLELQGATEQVGVRLEGAVDVAQATWQGRLAALTINSAGFGNWQLAEEAALAVAAGRVALGDSCLQSAAIHQSAQPGVAPARICASGEWSPANGASIAARMQSFALARLLAGQTGELSGDLHGALASGGALTGHAQFDISPGEMRVETGQGTQQLAHGGGQLDLVIGPAGLDAALEFKPLDDGQIQAELRLPQLNSLPLAGAQPLAGRIQAQLPDLSGLQGWVPELEAVAGRLDADLRLSGDLQQPELEGELALTDGAADVPVAGLQLREVQLRLRDDPGESAHMLLTGGLLSGGGRLELNGRLNPTGDMLALTLSGEAVEVFDTRDGQVLLSPDLDIDWSDKLLRLRGSVLMPKARITPKLGLGPGLASKEASAVQAGGAASEAAQIIVPSVDVVVLRGQGELEASAGPTLPFRLDSQVQLVLGEKVRVSSLGFVGDITGEITFRNRPEQTAVIPTADGRLKVEGGSFRAFGQNLDIETGQLIFRKVPVTEPEINLRAVRWIDNDPLVSAAGIQLSGPVAGPVMELFSRPQLDPSEIQSYLLTGHSASGEDSVLSIGTYLYPKLYVGYGHNLLEQTSEFDALYTITPRYGVDSSVGEADNSLGLTIIYER